MTILNPIANKIVPFIAGIGFLISLIVSIVSQAGIFSIIIRPIVSATVMAFLVYITFFIISFVSPDFTKELEEMNSETSKSDESLEDVDSTEASNMNDQENIEKSDALKNEENSHSTDFDDGILGPTDRTVKGKNISKKEGELLVEGVAIKNEPKLMAETIKDLLAKDEI